MGVIIWGVYIHIYYPGQKVCCQTATEILYLKSKAHVVKGPNVQNLQLTVRNSRWARLGNLPPAGLFQLLIIVGSA